jgi:hypothetical protein
MIRTFALIAFLVTATNAFAQTAAETENLLCRAWVITGREINGKYEVADADEQKDPKAAKWKW